MESETIKKIHNFFLSFHDVRYSPVQTENQVGPLKTEEFNNPEQYIGALRESGSALFLAYVRQPFPARKLQDSVTRANVPLLVFWQDVPGSPYRPAILDQDEDGFPKLTIFQRETEEVKTGRLVIPEQFYTDEEGNIEAWCTFALDQHIHEDFEDRDDKIYTPPTPAERLWRLFRSERKEIAYVYIYAAIAGLIALSLPLGIQSIIGFISSGQYSTSVFVLIAFIILGIIANGALQILMVSLVEYIQQRLFVKTAFEFAFRIPKISLEALHGYYPPELMNRFFDIITVQKGFSKLLIDLSGAALQILFGLIILSLYHPYFIFFGVILLVSLFIILRTTGPRGLLTNNRESKYKYQVANWLEELARTLNTFKLGASSNMPLEKTDYLVSNYVYTRKDHFKVLLTQYKSFVGFKTLVTAGLLILGCVLVINKEINIGQFVASEIIIILIMNSVEKLILSLDVVYDVLTSLDKIGQVTNLKLDTAKGMRAAHIDNGKGWSIEVKNLDYTFPDQYKKAVENISFNISPGEKFCISGYNNSGKSTLIHLLLGLYKPEKGEVLLNGFNLRQININTFLETVGDNLSDEELFDGTLLENITLGKKGLTTQDVLWAIEATGLDSFLRSLPDGLDTRLVGGNRSVSQSTAKKIILARSIVKKPKLLIIDDFLIGIERKEKLRLMEFLTTCEVNWTIILISNDPGIIKLCTRGIILRDGKQIASGTYDQIKTNPLFEQ